MSMTSTYSMQPVNASHQPVLWDMLYHAIYVPEGHTPPDRTILQHGEIARYVEHWGRAGDLGILAQENATGQPLGAAWLRLLSGPNRGYGYVNDDTPELSVAVLPGFRGQGLGTRLLLCLLEAASPTYAAISLSVDSRNPAQRLYRRLGFETIAADGAALIMMKRLTWPAKGTAT